MFAMRSSQDTLRIACIGNSITYGARLEDPAKNSYPAILQEKFDRGRVEVKNFGISGATIIRFGQPNLWQELEKIESYQPHIIILIIGTNETVSGQRQNWEHMEDFENDYYNFLSRMKVLASHPVIYICSPTDMVLETNSLSNERLADLSLRRPRLWILRKRVKRIARVSKVHYIDLTSKFTGRPDLFTSTDGVHPNKAGYNFLAESILKEIKNSINQSLK